MVETVIGAFYLFGFILLVLCLFATLIVIVVKFLQWLIKKVFYYDIIEEKRLPRKTKHN